MVVLKGKRAFIGKADLAERNASRCARQVDSFASPRTMDKSDHYARDTLDIYKPPNITWWPWAILVALALLITVRYWIIIGTIIAGFQVIAYICKHKIMQKMKEDDEYEDFSDKCYKWWDRITLLSLIVGFVLGVTFTLSHNDYGQIICAIVIGVSFGLHAANPFDNGGKLPNM